MKSIKLPRSQHSQNNVLNERQENVDLRHSEKCHFRILVSGPQVSLQLGFLESRNSSSNKLTCISV